MTNRIFMTALLLLVTIGGIVFASEENESVNLKPTIIHNQVNFLRENETLVVEARVDGASSRVAFMRLYYKGFDQNSYLFVEMEEGATSFWGELPPGLFSGPTLDYFILALLEDQQAITYPASNPYGNPITVAVAATGGRRQQPQPVLPVTPTITPEPNAGQVIQPDPDFEEETATKIVDDDAPILILSPEPGEEFGTEDEVLVAISFMPPETEEVEIESINLFISDNNVTRAAEIIDNLLTYTVSGLPPGKYHGLIQGYYKSGVEIPRASFNFVVKGDVKKRERSLDVSGRIFAETRHENISDKEFNDNNVGGYIAGKTGMLKYDGRFYLTSRESDKFQPRNRYSFNVNLPLIGVSIGDFHPRFNDLMLWGKRVRGVHGRLRLGFLNVDVVKGETRRRVKSRFITTIDTTTNLPDSTFNAGTFSQDLFGVRTSFGSGKNFQLGFNFLKVRDDTTSLQPDTSGTFFVLPKDNLVLGSDFLIAFDNRRIEFRAGAAFSWLTNDISPGALSKQDIEDQFDVELPVDPEDFAHIFILNTSTTPLDPRDLTSLAYNMNFRFNYFNNNLQLGYKSLGSEYNSLGNIFLRNNLRGFYVHDRIRFLQNRLYVNLGLEKYIDNFDSDDDNPSTDLNTISTGFSIYPGRNLPSLTFNLRNHIRDNGISDSVFVKLGGPTLTDTLAFINGENNNSKDWSVQMNYDTQFFNVTHNISVSFINNNRTDDFVPTSESSSNVQVFTVRTRYQFPLITTINFARNDNDFGSGLSKFKFTMFGVKGEYAFWNNKLKSYAGFNVTSAEGASVVGGIQTSITDYTRTAINFGTRFEISTGHYFLLDGNLINFSDNGKTLDGTTGLLTGNPSFSDNIFRLFYEKRF